MLKKNLWLNIEKLWNGHIRVCAEKSSNEYVKDHLLFDESGILRLHCDLRLFEFYLAQRGSVNITLLSW